MLYKDESSITKLGEEISDFSGKNNSLHYRDLKDAYTNSTLIDVNSVDISNRINDLDKFHLDRSNISYKLSDENKLMLEHKLKMEAKNEEIRLKHLSIQDDKNNVIFNRLQQRIIK